MATINGTGATDEIHGSDSDEDDLINGKGGVDELYGDFGDDTVDGGNGSDFLSGGTGDDLLLGRSGSDSFQADEGDDTIDGGSTFGPGEADTDAVYFFGDAVVANLATGIATEEGDFGGTDTLIDIEELHGSRHDDVLIGGNAANDDRELFEGGAGEDTIDGGTGHDIASYAQDFIYGPGSENGIVVRLAIGRIKDGTGSYDRISNVEEIHATRYSDDIVGDAHDNTFNPLFGADVIHGRGGTDTVSYRNDHSLAFGTPRRGIDADLGNGIIIDTSNAHDTVASIENVFGSQGDDQIRGNGGANRLDGHWGDDLIAGRGGNDTCSGGIGRDEISGGAGSDLITGGAGSDVLQGGGLADTFVFDLVSDWDTIRDFGVGADKIDVTAFGFASGDEVLDLASQRGSSVIIALNDDSTIELANTSLADVDAADFLV